MAAAVEDPYDWKRMVGMKRAIGHKGAGVALLPKYDEKRHPLHSQSTPM